MNANLVRPKSLVEGETYYYLENPSNGNQVQPIQVTLLAYDNCPALAVVCSAEGHQWRCPRERLFVSTYCRDGMCAF